MNHTRRDKSVSLCVALNPCHPERALSSAARGAQAQSKDPCNLGAAWAQAGSFRIAVRFFDEQNIEVNHPAIKKDEAGARQ